MLVRAWGFLGLISVAAALIYVPALHGFFGTAALSPGQLATVAPFPFIVWGADEIRRALVRRRSRRHRASGGPGDRAARDLARDLLP